MDKNEKEPKLFEGTKKVQIVAPKGNLTEHGDISWNSIVIVDGQEKTCAEFTLEELSHISPRRVALEKCKAYLYEKKSSL
jgi:inosine/xanthosine triphosphate pyrophosphatase family protein